MVNLKKKTKTKGAIVKDIEEKIGSGQLKEGDILLSQKVLSETYKVNVKTVGSAIQELSARGLVYTVPKTGTFVGRTKIERQNSSANTKVKIVLHKEELDAADTLIPITHDFIKGIYDEASANSLLTEIVHLPERPEDWNIQAWTEGLLIFLFHTVDGHIIEYLKKHSIPYVILFRSIEWQGLNVIYFDTVRGAYEATEYLIELRHKAILFLTQTLKHSTYMHRYRGYLEALSDYGMEDSHMVLDIGQNNLIDMGEFEKMLRRKQPTAIFAASDRLAIDAYRILNLLNIRLPDDLSIVGFDDRTEARELTPPLTTVRLPRYDLGRKAAKMVIEQYQSGDLTPRRVLVEPKLIIRESCQVMKEQRLKEAV